MGNVASHISSRLTTHGLVDRETGKGVQETMPFYKALEMWLLYNTPIGHALLVLPPTWWVIGLQHKRIAAHANSPASKKDIPSFIKTYSIDTAAAEKLPEEYPTLQAYFARRIKPELRPIDEPRNGSVAVMPADSRCVVYNDVTDAHRFWIKGRNFNVPRLLGQQPNDPVCGSAHDWQHCAVAINRLSPTDHHRLHASVTGHVTRIRKLGTRFMGSEWAATHNSPVNVMTENERLVMEFDTREFGPVVQVMVGASEVGSVQPLVSEGARVSKGDEVAVFGYGGSIMATLFGAGSIEFDLDLRDRSAGGVETLVRYGMRLGAATGHVAHQRAPSEADS